MSLENMGFSPFFMARWMMMLSESGRPDDELAPARVIRVERGALVIDDGAGQRAAVRAGALRGNPAVGDFVVVETATDPARVIAVLERRGALYRRRAGSDHEAQVVAANVDCVVLVAGLDVGANVRRLERGLTLAWDADATPLVVLNKCDVETDMESVRSAVADACPGVEVLAVSALERIGVDALAAALAPGSTSVFIGPSGAGKSSLINALLGADRLATGAVRARDGKGRHTTTSRQLFALAHGALVIDTPGTRELGLIADESALAHTFPDIAALAGECRFRDCEHQDEPGCAVAAAVGDGRLDPGRVASFHKQKRELRHLAERDAPTDHEKRARERGFGRIVKEAQARKRGR